MEIAAWAAERGLKLIEDEVRRQLGIEDLHSLIVSSTREINGKLDAIIRAPYKEALMHLRAGDLREAKIKLIQAIALDELDLPAMLLYIRLLCLEGNFPLALEYCCEVLDTFGLGTDAVPGALFAAYRERYLNTVIRPGAPKRAVTFGLGSEDTDFRPRLVACSLAGCVVIWERPASLWPPRLWEKYAATVVSWEDRVMVRIDDVSEVAAVTNRYVALPKGSDEVQVIRWKDGAVLPRTLSRSESATLFGAAARTVSADDLAGFTFCGVTFARGQHSESRLYYGKSGTSQYTLEYGQLTLRFAGE